MPYIKMRPIVKHLIEEKVCFTCKYWGGDEFSGRCNKHRIAYNTALLTCPDWELDEEEFRETGE